MAERSKAPDSREILFTNSERAFWSSSEGVGSNPTSDKNFNFFIDLVGHLNILNNQINDLN